MQPAALTSPSAPKARSGLQGAGLAMPERGGLARSDERPWKAIAASEAIGKVGDWLAESSMELERGEEQQVNRETP